MRERHFDAGLLSGDALTMFEILGENYISIAREWADLSG